MSMLINPFWLPPELWTPADLPVAPQIWLNETSGMSLSSTSVNQWDDISGNGFHGTQSGSARPIANSSGLNSMRTVEFDGSDDSLLFSGATGVMRNTGAGWAIGVAKKTALDGSNLLRSLWGFSCDTTHATARRLGLDLGLSTNSNRPSSIARRLDADGGAVLSASGDTDTNWHLWMVIQNWSNGNGYLYLDGAIIDQSTPLTSTGSTSNTASDAVRLGSTPQNTGRCDCSVAEWVVGSGSVPSSDDIDRLHGALAWKWGIQANLSGGHPYASAAPYA